MQFMPHPVTSGFTMGIAVVLAALQLKDVFGVRLPRTEGVFEYVEALVSARHAFNYWDLGVAMVTLGLLLGLPRVLKRVPAPLVALTVVAVAVVILGHVLPVEWGFNVTTIGSRFTYPLGGGQVGHGIPPLPPIPVLPWQVVDPGHPGFSLNLQVIRELLPSAFAIAMLGAIESLMAAVVADGMGGTRHDPNSELIALGVANIVCPFFGGIAATGALARTATNLRAGARSPFAAAMHAIFILACTIALAPLVSYLPMAALAALLVAVARNLSEARHFWRLTRIAPRHDVMVMMTCFILTVVFDMVIAVTVGVVLAALLFMRRMSMLTKIELETPSKLKIDVPHGIRVYEIAGPLFFGAAKSAMEALHTVGDKDHTYIIDMRLVPTMDATGLVALESVLDRLHRSKVKVIFAALTHDVSEMFGRAGIKREEGKIGYAPDVETAVSMAIVHAARTGAPMSSPSMKLPPDSPSAQG
jgi:sulfate permease, SulP family